MGTLSALRVKSLMKEPGRHADGSGLYLVVKPSGSSSWMLRVQFDGKRHDYGIGSAKDVKLLEARDKASEYRKLARKGIDPLASKEADRKKAAAKPTFQQAAERAHREFSEGWKNDKHAAQWLSTLTAYAFPMIGKLPVDQVDAGRIVRVLSPIWLEVPETARRVKQRIGVVLDWALANGFREIDAPMRAVSKGLKKQPANTGHFAALPYEKIPALMQALAAKATVGSMALQFTILTAARSGEVRGATWGEIDMAAKLWTVPSSRMKAGKDHVVPLSAPAAAILVAIKAGRSVAPADVIFPGKAGKALSDMTLGKTLRAATDQHATVHGFRSSFRDWTAEKEVASNDVAEAALAHTPPTKVIAAYRRTNFLELRRDLMNRWAEFVAPTAKASPAAGAVAGQSCKGGGPSRGQHTEPNSGPL